MNKRKFSRLGKALDARTAEWFERTEPQIYGIIEEEVAEGAQPDEIVQFVREHVGDHREGLIASCRSAARHMAATIRERA